MPILTGLPSVQRVRARVWLDDPQPSLAEAIAERDGDDDARRWLEDYERGDALVVRIDLALEFEDGVSEGCHVLRATSPGIWIERRSDPPSVEAQIGEIIGGDATRFANALRARGVHFTEERLAEMHIHIDLDQSLRLALAPRASRWPTVDPAIDALGHQQR